MMTTPSAGRLSALTQLVTWQVRGVVENDVVHRYKFGLRDLWQRAEIAKREEWAHHLVSESANDVRLDRAVGFLADPFEGRIDLDPVCRLGSAIAREAEQHAKTSGTRKAFHVNHLLPIEHQATMLKLVLNDELLRLASTYLGIVPVLGDLDMFCSLPTPEGMPYTSSQLYHCDDTSLTQVKFFIYCDDVGDHDGPLQVVDATRSKMVRDRVHYRYGGRACRVADNTMDALVPAVDQRSLIGPRGSSFLVDTARCFHRGSRIRQSDRRRMVGIIQFVPPNCTQLPLRLRHGAPFRHLATPSMSSLARAVLGEPVG